MSFILQKCIFVAVSLEPKTGFPKIVVSEINPIMLNRDMFCLENSVDPDQLASEKPADQDLHCFLLFVTY